MFFKSRKRDFFADYCRKKSKHGNLNIIVSKMRKKKWFCQIWLSAKKKYQNWILLSILSIKFVEKKSKNISFFLTLINNFEKNIIIKWLNSKFTNTILFWNLKFLLKIAKIYSTFDWLFIVNIKSKLNSRFFC